jgi:hypothetical protein
VDIRTTAGVVTVNVADLRTADILKLPPSVSAVYSNNAAMSKTLDRMERLMEAAESGLALLAVQMTNATERAWKAGYAAAKNEASKSPGVPEAVMTQIRANAVSKWPGDYNMQRFEIERQVTAWVDIHH